MNSRRRLAMALGLMACLLAIASPRLVAAERKQQSAPPAASSPTTTKVIRRWQTAPVEVGRTISESEAQALVNAPISRNYVSSGFYSRYAKPRNYGATDVGGRGTATGRGISQVPDEPFTTTTLYGGYSQYFTPRGYVGSAMGTGGLYGFGYGWGYGPYQMAVGGYGGIGGGPIGFPYGMGAGLYRPRYFAPYWYYPARTGFSVYNPYFYYGNSFYGGYSAPAWSGYGGFGFPYSATFGGFGYPYSYAAYGYPYYSFMRPTQTYLPTYAYFMYPGVGGLYVPPGYFGFPGYYGYGGYGTPLGSYGYGGAFYW